MIVGCYSLDLYCDNSDADKNIYPDSVGNMIVPHWEAWQYLGKTGGQARNEARKAGWKLDLQKQTAICPRCRKGAGNEQT